jgi:hypothetical protein
MTRTAMNGFLGVIVAGLVLAWSASSALAANTKGDFALLDEPGGDVSVQCGATAGGKEQKPAIFTMHVTMTNRGDLGGAQGFVRVLYQDGDFVDYAIPPNTSVQISMAGGGTPGVDDIVTVHVDGGGGSMLIGQASLSTDKGKPHPNLPGQDGKSFCTTS